MDEHDDDLESTVHEEGEEEVEGYPNTGDELDDEADEDTGDLEEEPDLDKDLRSYDQRAVARSLRLSSLGQ
jgi:hypothetical protein